MSTDEWLNVCDDLDDGVYDDGLDKIIAAATSRQEVVARRNARRLLRELKVKDRVMLGNGITPRFFEGMVGTVKELRGEIAVVILDEVPSGRGRTPEDGRSNKVQVELLNIIKLDEDDPRAEKPKKEKKVNPEEIGDDAEYEDEDEYEED